MPLRSRLGVLLLTAGITLGACAPASAAPAAAGDVGQDVSYPQCGGALPAAGAFGLVGVTDGTAFSANPCLSSEWSWASARAADPAFVTTPANPAPTSTHYWPQSGKADPVLCKDATTTTDPGCAYDYGHHAAADALAAASAATSSATATAAGWWLDVETSNTYNGDTTSNAADLQGMVDYLRGQGVPWVGFYSTSYQWGVITGGWTAGNDASYRAAWRSELTPAFPMSAAPDWVAGAASGAEAQSSCATSFSGGPTTLAQYPDGGYDADLVCGSVPSAPRAVVASARNAGAVVSWSAPAAPGGSVVQGYTVKASPGSSSCTTSGATTCTVTGLSNGTAYTFTVTATNSYGTSPTSAASAAISPDGTAPAVTVSALPAASLGTVTLRYSATDTSSGVASYDVRYRAAAFNGGFGALAYPGGWQHITTRSVSLTPTRGATYCFSVRARDKVGNVSGWSGERCTAAPIDDRSLTASSGWTSGASGAYYASTYRRALSTGRTLTRSGLQTKRVSIVATTCHGCGTIGIYWNGRLMRQVSLNATTTHYRQVLAAFALSAPAAGTLTIKTLSSGQVLVDGVASSRV